MGTYGIDGVLRAWMTEQLTAEQAVGQILQLLQELEKRVTTLEGSGTRSKSQRLITETQPSKDTTP